MLSLYCVLVTTAMNIMKGKWTLSSIHISPVNQVTSQKSSTVAHKVFESIPWNWVSIEQHLIKICKEYFLKLGFNFGPFKLIIKNFMVSNA